MDKLDITGLRVSTTIGVFAWEQQIKQRLVIDLTLTGDFSNCQDQLSHTIDYDHLCQRITTHVESNTFALIETVAEQIVQLIQQEFRVERFSVRVSKPSAISNAANVSITLER